MVYSIVDGEKKILMLYVPDEPNDWKKIGEQE